jgi:hypothetical protein
MRTKIIKTLSLLGIVTLTAIAQVDSIDYFGQTPLGDSAVIFAPGIISLPNRSECALSFHIA